MFRAPKCHIFSMVLGSYEVLHLHWEDVLKFPSSFKDPSAVRHNLVLAVSWSVVACNLVYIFLLFRPLVWHDFLQKMPKACYRWIHFLEEYSIVNRKRYLEGQGFLRSEKGGSSNGFLWSTVIIIIIVILLLVCCLCPECHLLPKVCQRWCVCDEEVVAGTFRSGSGFFKDCFKGLLVHCTFYWKISRWTYVEPFQKVRKAAAYCWGPMWLMVPFQDCSFSKFFI